MLTIEDCTEMWLSLVWLSQNVTAYLKGSTRALKKYISQIDKKHFLLGDEFCWEAVIKKSEIRAGENMSVHNSVELATGSDKTCTHTSISC